MQITTAVNLEEWFGLLDSQPYPTPTTSEYQSEKSPIKSEFLLEATPKKEISSPSDDLLARKRQKQNEAARRCRLKKVTQLSEYKEQVTKLQNQLFEKDIRLAIIEKERFEWQKREEEYKREIDLLRKERDDYFTIANLHCAK